MASFSCVFYYAPPFASQNLRRHAVGALQRMSLLVESFYLGTLVATTRRGQSSGVKSAPSWRSWPLCVRTSPTQPTVHGDCTAILRSQFRKELGAPCGTPVPRGSSQSAEAKGKPRRTAPRHTQGRDARPRHVGVASGRLWRKNQKQGRVIEVRRL